MDTPPFARVSVGDVIEEKFRVERILGSGGMGIVVAARHAELDELVAIKLMHPAELANAQAIARFSREAKAAAKLRSEHIARVFDAGKTEQGVPYMVLEYLEGCDLNDLAKERGCLPVQEAALYVMQATEALVVAHAAGIIHRDLKPANLYLTKRSDGSPCIKVLDFGISKRVIDGRAPSGFTRTTDVMGSPQYMSPEQMRSTRDVDARTDIWALGAILYKLLSGEAPFAARSLADVYQGILEREPKRLGIVRPDVPLELESLVRRCLRKNPDDRFASAAELSAALAPFAPEEEAPRSVRVMVKSRQAVGSHALVSMAPQAIGPAPDDVPTSRDALATLPSATFKRVAAETSKSAANPSPSPTTCDSSGAPWAETAAPVSSSARATRAWPSRIVLVVALVAVAIGGTLGVIVSPDREGASLPALAQKSGIVAPASRFGETTLSSPRGRPPGKREGALPAESNPTGTGTKWRYRAKTADPTGRSRK